jgi:hypothetical protein
MRRNKLKTLHHSGGRPGKEKTDIQRQDACIASKSQLNNTIPTLFEVETELRNLVYNIEEEFLPESP